MGLLGIARRPASPVVFVYVRAINKINLREKFVYVSMLV